MPATGAVRAGRRPVGAGLYVHVPFCASKCAYCDFASVPSGSIDAGAGGRHERFVDAVLGRARDLAREEGIGPFATVYVGGGTPTLLAPAQLGRLLGGLRALAPGAEEFTVEANPESLDAGRLSAMEDSGATRVSLGVQSLEDAALSAVGRRASAADARGALDLIAARWKGALSVDLMESLPGGTPEGLALSAKEALAAGAKHVSLYELTLEETTPLARAVGAGTVRLPDEGLRAETHTAVESVLAGAALFRYEVSNWAARGSECLHNLNYWAAGEWIGAGPSAAGQKRLADGGVRRRAASVSVERFLADPAAGEEIELVAPREAFFEALMLGWRTARGVDLRELEARFGAEAARLALDFAASRPDALAFAEGAIAPTARGMDILNPVLVALGELIGRRFPVEAVTSGNGA
ncbi:MAG: coproporphyrinogen III oxidase family protein [Spirochaetales bacterium]|nr:coproporphyrinogen III oxidase family protein [Spirochaetales bacterium]